MKTKLKEKFPNLKSFHVLGHGMVSIGVVTMKNMDTTKIGLSFMKNSKLREVGEDTTETETSENLDTLIVVESIESLDVLQNRIDIIREKLIKLNSKKS